MKFTSKARRPRLFRGRAFQLIGGRAARALRRAAASGAVLSLLALLLAGCSGTPAFSYAQASADSRYTFLNSSALSARAAEPFAQSLCVAAGDVEGSAPVDYSDVSAAALFDVGRGDVLSARNIFTKLYPASMTKVMTALLALKHGQTDMMLTASDNVVMTEPGAQVCGIAPGDTMTLDQALHLLLIYSANDAAVMIAEGIGGSLDNFIAMMNEEARALGATNTNFINSNGLNDENHYTTAYDMYLIFNEAVRYDLFKEIINMPSYSTVYHDEAGKEKELTVNSTNMYLQNVESAPQGVTVVGGKTGTTNAAGHCLILLVRDTSGNPYISIVMRAKDNDTMYEVMNALLEQIP